MHTTHPRAAARITALTLAAALALAPAAQAAYAFDDVAGHWAEQDIAALASGDILQGADGHFRPDDPITRGEMAVVMARLLDLTEEAEDIFKDLDDGFYRHAVLCCFQVGVMKGDHKIDNEKKAFRPRDPITREEAALTLARAFEIAEDAAGADVFSDCDGIALWAAGAVGGLAARGFALGRDDGSFDPKATITRAEVAALICRLQAAQSDAGEQLEEAAPPDGADKN